MSTTPLKSKNHLRVVFLLTLLFLFGSLNLNTEKQKNGRNNTKDSVWCDLLRW